MSRPYIIYGLFRPDRPIFYVGRTYDLQRRLREHRQLFGREIDAKILERGYGDVAGAEHRWIEEYRSRGHTLANKTDGFDGGETLSESAKAKLRAINLGKKMSPDAIERSASKRRGQKRSAETRRRMSEAQLKRPPQSAETRAKISAALTGHTHNTPDAIAKMSAAKKGRIFTADHRSKLSLAKLGNNNRTKNKNKTAGQLSLF